MDRSILELLSAISGKTHVLPVCELAGDAESGFEALDFYANYPDLPVENERGRLAWDDYPAFQVLSR